MKRFLMLYSGPPAPPDATHAGWPEWFASLGDALVDMGSPTRDGIAVRGDGSTSDEPLPLHGYGLIQAEDRSAAVELVRDHPLLALGGDYAIEVFEVPRKAG